VSRDDAIAYTPSGDSCWTASATAAARPGGPSPLLAARITAIASAASDSTAAIISALEGIPCSQTRTSRRRASASAGSSETASNALARRWPPAPLRRPPACGEGALEFLIVVGVTSMLRDRLAVSSHPLIGIDGGRI
jgi:hypothetical protein